MIAYYISSHGFGHAVRSCEVIRNLPPEIPLTLRTAVPEWFLRRELIGRDFEIETVRFDVGTLGSDSSQIDFTLTLDAAEAMLKEGEAALARETQWLRDNHVRLVVTDIAPLALEAASAAGLPSILIANFTWNAIYRHLADSPSHSRERARAEAVIDRMTKQYAMGDLLLIPEFDVPMEACRKQRRTPLIARRGRNRRAELAAGLNLEAARPIHLVYLGREGMKIADGADARQLEGLQLIGFKPDSADPENDLSSFVRAIPEDLIDHSDLAASVDGVLAKPGYGLCGECMAAGTPLAHLPRPAFSETAAIEAALEKWGGAVPMPLKDFENLNWRPYLDALATKRKSVKPVEADGGRVCAEIITEWRKRI